MVYLPKHEWCFFTGKLAGKLIPVPLMLWETTDWLFEKSGKQNSWYTVRIQICTKKGCSPIILHGMFQPSILHDREGSGFLGIRYKYSLITNLDLLLQWWTKIFKNYFPEGGDFNGDLRW